MTVNPYLVRPLKKGKKHPFNFKNSNKMKRIFKKIPLESWLAILAAVLIVIIAQVFPRYHTMQYLENGELKTESFKGRKEFSERAQELRADSIKYWLYLED